jgi:hypothetical protein
MRIRLLWCAGALLWSSALVAQALKASAVSGTWAGTVGPDEANRQAVNLQLKLTGKAVSGVVTGPALTPGDITAGTYDEATGAIALTVAIRGDGGKIQFTGALARDTMTIRAINDGREFVLRATRTGEAGSTSSAVPAGPRDAADSTAAVARRGFTEVSGWVTRAAALVPPDRYTYRPVQTVRTFGQVVAHVVDAFNYYCPRAAGKTVQWADAAEKGALDKASLTAKLKQSIDACNAVYAGKGQPGALFENVTHANLHYGNLVTYIRMIGLVPPSS